MNAPQSPRESIPGFRLPASTGHTLESDSFKDKVPLVLLFLEPANARSDDLLVAVNERLKDFGSERTQILVVMSLTARETRELADERGLAVPVLADASGSMARDFDVSDTGRPVAVVADKAGGLVRRFDPLPDDEDPQEVVEALLYAVRAIGSGALIPGDHDPTA